MIGFFLCTQTLWVFALNGRNCFVEFYWKYGENNDDFKD